MRTIAFSIIAILFLHISAAQTVSITPNNLHGDTNHFEIVHDSIWLNNDSAVTSNFSTINWSFQGIRNGILKFRYYFGENASSSNFSTVKLHTDSSSSNYIALRLGHTNDNFSIWNSNQGNELLIYESQSKIFDFKPTHLDIELHFSSNQVWVHITDLTNTVSYYSDTLAISYQYINKCAWEIKYSKTRAKKFSLNNWNFIGEIYADSEGPKLISEIIIPEKTLQYSFDEKIKEYKVYPSSSTSNIVYDNNILKLESNNDSVLKFDSIIVTDSYNNRTIISNKLYEFDFLKRDDIIITEIMADPLPQVLLATTEYIELYNTTNDTVTIDDWTIADMSSSQVLPNFSIAPKQHISISKDSLHLPNNIVLPNLPSLNNSSDEIFIRDNFGRLIHYLHYTSGWHTSTSKKDGGWSLELIDPTKPCLGSNNWSTSTNFKGGSPGAPNSVSRIIQDTAKPSIETIQYTRDSSVIIQLDKRIRDFQIDNYQNNINITSSHLSDIEQDQITLNYSTQANGTDTILIKSIEDCSGDKTQISIPIYSTSDTINKLMLNEILFNPQPYGADFIELYNLSEKAIWLDQLFLFNKNEFGYIEEFIKATDKGLLVPPKQFIVLTEDKQNILINYDNTQSTLIYEVDKLPKLPDDMGNIFICDSAGKIIDSLIYNEDYHNPFLGSTEGVSLEKTRLRQYITGNSNWKSASSTYDFGSPTLPNSMSENEYLSNSVQINFNTDILSPNADGYNDYLKIEINNEQNSSLCTISVFDMNGQHLHTICQNEILGNKSTIEWDGEFNGYEYYNNSSIIVLIEILYQSSKSNKIKYPILYQLD